MARSDLRRRDRRHSRVTNVELFFDLVFVFAVTQLSHSLLHHLTPLGAAQTGVLFMAVWWVWTYTAWVTNWQDPDRWPVRLMLLVLMLLGLVLSTSLPQAFQGRPLAFAGAYTVMQLGRTLFMIWALSGQDEGNKRNFLRILAWLCVSAVLWIAGAFAEPTARLALWGAAIFIEYLSPAVSFWTPGLGRSTTADWDVDGDHLAERCSLFVIIALGESVLVTGAAFADLAWAPLTLGAFAIAFVGSLAMWWIYFDTGAERAAQNFAHSSDPGAIARLSYTYLHMPIVAGIIVSAVADDLLVAEPLGAMTAPVAAVIVGGPALYVLGALLFKRTALGRWHLSHLIGLALLIGLIPPSFSMSPLLLGGLVTGVLLLVATWETMSFRGKGPIRLHGPKEKTAS